MSSVALLNRPHHVPPVVLATSTATTLDTVLAGCDDEASEVLLHRVVLHHPLPRVSHPAAARRVRPRLPRRHR